MAANINWEIDPVNYQPSTILYAEELNESFNSMMRVVQGTVLALGDYYGNGNPSEGSVDITISTSAEDVYNYIQKCLSNLHIHRTDSYEDIVELNYSNNGGIRVKHSNLIASKVQEMVFNNDGIKFNVANDFKVEATGDTSAIELKNNSNTLKLTKTTDELFLNNRQVVCTISSEEKTTIGNVDFVKKIWYSTDLNDRTIYFE